MPEGTASAISIFCSRASMVRSAAFSSARACPWTIARISRKRCFISCLKLDTLHDEARFPGWLLTICRNVFNNEIERRRAKKRYSPEAGRVSTADVSRDEIELIASVNPSSNPLKRVLDKEKVHAFWVAIQQLPHQMREVYLSAGVA